MDVDLQSRDSLLLPSHYFIEQNSLLSLDSTHTNINSPSCFGSSDPRSTLSSPVGPDLGSIESESEQHNDYAADLTRQMAHHMLLDDDMVCSLAGSPQSLILSRLRLNTEDVLHTPTMGKVEKSNTTEEYENRVYSEKVLSNLLKSNSASEFQFKQALIDDQIRAFHFYKLKREQFMRQQESSGWGKQADSPNQVEPKQRFRKSQSKGRPTQKASWANMAEKNRTDSEMRAVFLGNHSGSRRGSGGTGVFLPRETSNTSESRKKSGCSTVLVPAKVVRALRLHFEKMGAASGSNGDCFPLQPDTLMFGGHMRYGLQVQQKSQHWTVPAMDCHQELSLPQEWTY